MLKHCTYEVNNQDAICFNYFFLKQNKYIYLFTFKKVVKTHCLHIFM